MIFAAKAARRRNAVGGPSLDLDFAGTGAVDPRITFTRASGATCVTGAGLVASAATNVPRMEHDPITGARLGLLLAEARTNPLTWSSDMTNAAWLGVLASISGAAGVSPSGASDAFRLTETATTGAHQSRSLGGASGTSTARTMSVWAKAGERIWLRLNLFGGGVDNQAWFDLSTGARGAVTAGVTSRMAAFSNGWYRCELTVVSAYSVAVFGMANADNVKDYAGDGTSGLLLWGPQIEEGFFASSYIATTTAAATRAADVATLSGTNFSSWFNPAGGTFIANYYKANGAPRFAYFAAAGGAGWELSDQNDRRINLRNPPNAAADFVISVSAGGAGLLKFGMSHAGVSFGGSTGGAAAVLASYATPPTPTELRLSSAISGAAQTVIFSRLRYYPRVFSSAELQAATA